ncbi:molybdopterin molybdotransferase MoeA [Isoptericola variabilis]|uniref:Molybdopterin molybdenumtransferase n=1 Tax=Isoptericola variabilis (strain 225) TaxID=743718 RepID=F6FR02_ISOV2|nr:molybdopterin molybdotransferase MoeA [Isoptericola variabilis]AEG44952.1 molybdenum cofactor synthesis domain protein [Isoptericola variabilis 225]TWH26036.1 molybdopterin molybdotransferase [Isoptericola variabilis J7]
MTDGPVRRTIAEHAAAVLARVAPLPAVPLALPDAAASGLGLVLARDVVAAAAVPPFDHAAMDGYAVRLADLPDDGTPVTLPVTGSVHPGSAAVGMISGPNRPDDPDKTDQKSCPQRSGGRGRRAVRIMTGAPLPAWADAVVPVERTSTGRFVAGGAAVEQEVTLSRPARTHVRTAGEDLRTGDVLARAGDEVTPALVAVAAAAGLSELWVHRRPRVAVLSTGSELVAATATAAPGAVPDSNSLMLAALARAAGADVVRVGAVPDDAAALRTALDGVVSGPVAHSEARNRADSPLTTVDLVVTSGGVSAGASDVVREVLASADPALSDVELAAVAMRPGRPQALARWRGVPWVAVPGNPVSAFVSFALFVRPAIARLAGGAPPAARTARAAVAWGTPPGREAVVPVRVLGSGEVEPAAPLHGAADGAGHHLSALLAADALAIVPADVEKVAAGDEVTVLGLPGRHR